MKWLTAKPQVKIFCAAAAFVMTCGAAMGASDTEQFQRFQDPNQWGAPAGNLNQTRYSALKDINTGNAKDLQMIWAQSSGTLRGHEGQPLVIEDVGGKPMMFMESGWPNIVQALDLSDPDHPVQVWSYTKTSGRDESAVPRACCDTVNRGLSYSSGKLVFATLDGYVIALDAVTGKEAWVVKHAYPDQAKPSRRHRSSPTTKSSSDWAAMSLEPAAVFRRTTSPTARKCGNVIPRAATKMCA